MIWFVIKPTWCTFFFKIKSSLQVIWLFEFRACPYHSSIQLLSYTPNIILEQPRTKITIFFCRMFSFAFVDTRRTFAVCGVRCVYLVLVTDNSRRILQHTFIFSARLYMRILVSPSKKRWFPTSLCTSSTKEHKK